MYPVEELVITGCDESFERFNWDFEDFACVCMFHLLNLRAPGISSCPVQGRVTSGTSPQ